MILAFLRRATPAAVALAALTWIACFESSEITGPAASRTLRLTEHTASLTWAIPGTDPEVMVTMTRLGELEPGGTSQVFGINENGVVVGEASVPAPEDLNVFYWTQADGMQGISDPSWTDTRGIDVNENGVIVGRGFFEGGAVRIGFRWDGAMTPLVAHGSGVGAAQANVAYMDDTALGWSQDNAIQEAVRWTTASNSGDPAFGNGIDIRGANDSGDLVGLQLGNQAFLWKNFPNHFGAENQIPIDHLNGATEGFPADVNASAQVVGWVRSPTRAFIWEEGVAPQELTGLGASTAQAFGINDDALAVGESRAADGLTHATAWVDGTALDLHPPEGAVAELNRSSAVAVNNSGLIAGSIRVGADRKLYAVVWTMGDGNEEPPPPTLEELLTMLEDEINALGGEGVLNQGQANSLTKKIDGALEKVEDDKIKAAINKLEAFVNEVEALVNGGTLTSEQGQALIDLAQAAIDLLNST